MSFSSVKWPEKQNTFEWLKVVSEVIYPRFWGVVCIEKCFRNFEIVIGSAVFEMLRFARFYRVGSTFCQTWSCKNL